MHKKHEYIKEAFSKCKDCGYIFCYCCIEHKLESFDLSHKTIDVLYEEIKKLCHENRITLQQFINLYELNPYVMRFEIKEHCDDEYYKPNAIKQYDDKGKLELDGNNLRERSMNND